MCKVHKYRKLYYNGSREKDVVWLAFLTSKTFEEAEKILLNILDVSQVNEIMEEVINLNNNVVLLHEWENERLSAYEMQSAKYYAQKEGFEEGVDIGAEQRENSIIINMLDKNIDINIISEVTGRPIRDIEEIKKKL